MSAARPSWGLTEEDELVPGRTVVRLLGGGSRYEVYLVWEDRLRALVVAKVLRPGMEDDHGARRGLSAEAKLLGRLAHPMLPRTFGHVLEGERPHLLLAFAEGPRLSTLIRRYGVITEQLLPLALNVCAVLHYLRAEGVVHLDVKPSNIVMSGDPKLIDLSVARTAEEIPRIHEPVGTDAYMAPEQCDPERFEEIGSPADVWGLGVTLYEALTGARPFADPREGERWPQLRAAPRPLADGVPPVLAHAVMSCLERRPADRPTPAQLGDALEPVVDALPPPRLGRFRPAPPRRRGKHR